MSNNLFWRSQSQPPFEVTTSFVGSTEPTNSTTNAIDSDFDQLMGYSSIVDSTIQDPVSNELLPHNVRFQSPIRSAFVNSWRNNASHRSSRSTRATVSSRSSSSNSSLIGRYRTISGTNLRPQINDCTTADTHISRLLRFASLRFDPAVRSGADIGIASGRRYLQLINCNSDLDEFIQLPTRTRPDSSSLNVIPRSNSNTNMTEHISHFSHRTTANQSPFGELCSTSVEQTSINDENLVTNTNTAVNTNNVDVQSESQVEDAFRPADIIIPSSSNTLCVKFPKRYGPNRNVENIFYTGGCAVSHTNSMEFSSPSTNYLNASNHEPEADHDFYFNSHLSISNKNVYRSRDHVDKTFIKLNQLRCERLFCDVVLKCGSSNIAAHRNVLAASCPYFYAMFSGMMTEARSPCVEFQGIDGNALNQLIHFIYTNEIVVNEDTVQSLLPAANLLQLHSVRDACCEFLQLELHPSNCLGIQQFADLHNCPDLLDFSRRFSEQHFGELLNDNEEFLALDASQLTQLISSDRLAVSEDRVFEAVLRWVAHDADNRQIHARDLCARVRFGLLPREYLVSLSQSDQFLTKNPWCKDYLIEALGYHLLPWDQKLHVSTERTKPRTPIGLPKMLLVIGGQAPKAIRSVECFEFRAGTWILPSRPFKPELTSPETCLIPAIDSSHFVLSDLPSRRCRFGVGVHRNLVYVIGGFNGALRVRSTEIFDQLRNTWHSGPNMEFRRATLGVAVLNGLIYAVGGFNGSTGLNSAEVFDVTSCTWNSIASMTFQRSSVGVSALDGKLYAVGGYDGAIRRCLSSVECYNPTTKKWNLIAEMNFRRSGPAVCELNNRLYAVGGHDGPVVQRSAEVYSTETESWQRIADLNAKRRNASIVTHDGFLYIVGGEDGDTNLSSIEKYDPNTDTWTILPQQLVTGRSYAGVAIVDRSLCLIPNS